MELENLSIEKLKKLNFQELEDLASKMKEFMIDSTALTGGHIGANLSSLEIKDLEVELFVNNIKSGQLVSNLKPNINKNFEFKVYSGSEDINNGWFKIPSDNFSFDNKKFFQFRKTKKIKILFFHRKNEFSGPIKYVFSSINHSNQCFPTSYITTI